MARTSRSGAPPPSVDALDNVDLDGLFADDGDALFDDLGDDLGIDLGMDQMDLDVKPPEPSQEEEKAEEAPVEEEKPVERPTRRRRTKRKTKSPNFFDDDDDEYSEEPQQPKNKRRRSAANKKARPSKGKKKPEEDSTESSPGRKTKNAQAAGMPPPTARSNVAAAGQFGRLKRPTHALPLARGASSRSKSKSAKLPKAAPAASTAIAPKARGASAVPPSSGPTEMATAATAQPPKVVREENTFCGIHPSDTIFYPFMPSLPTEPGIKSRKVYPVMDRLNTTFTSALNAPGSTENGLKPVNENEPIFRLMADSAKEHNSAAPQDEKRTLLSSAIGNLRKTISEHERTSFAGDLLSVCALLQRQHGFLKQNLCNMERWCKGNFSASDYASTYGSPNKPLPRFEPLPVSMFAKMTTPFIAVKIKIAGGFKEPKKAGPLMALLPLSVIAPPPPPPPITVTKSAVPAAKAATKKRKVDKTPPTAVAAEAKVPAVSEPTPYAKLRPLQRRQRVSEALCKVMQKLEVQNTHAMEEQRLARTRRATQLKKLVEEDEVVVIHTSGMWQWIEKAGIFANFNEEDIADMLRSVWAPEEEETTLAWLASIGTPEKKKRKHQPRTTHSLFDRLGSLLVEEGSDDDIEESDVSNSDDDSLSEWHDMLEHEASASEDLEDKYASIADLSRLSLDERAFLQLCKAGVLNGKKQTYSSIILDKEEDESNISAEPNHQGNGEKSHTNETPQDDDEVEAVIDAMTADLDRLNKVNNARVAFLSKTATTTLSVMKQAKKKAEEETVLIAKVQQLLKKNKEGNKAKNAKPRASKKDDLGLPW